MIATLWETIFRKLPVLKQIDGYKRLISAVLILVAAVSWCLTNLAPLFPDLAWLAPASKSVKELLDTIAQLAAYIGVPGYVVGVIDAKVKAKK